MYQETVFHAIWWSICFYQTLTAFQKTLSMLLLQLKLMFNKKHYRSYGTYSMITDPAVRKKLLECHMLGKHDMVYAMPLFGIDFPTIRSREKRSTLAKCTRCGYKSSLFGNHSSATIFKTYSVSTMFIRIHKFNIDPPQNYGVLNVHYLPRNVISFNNVDWRNSTIIEPDHDKLLETFLRRLLVIMYTPIESIYYYDNGYMSGDIVLSKDKLLARMRIHNK